ncbi:MAG: 3-dehydroquinate synthase, partial [Bacteroidota bacterium]|nr:3-dehydroquinate synthase [Bacteroidota bacterium]
MINQEVLPRQFKFSGKKIDCFFGADFSLLEEKIQKENTVFVTDENIFSAHGEKFSGWQTIVIKAGEEFKNQKTVDKIIDQLIHLKADRQT